MHSKENFEFELFVKTYQDHKLHEIFWIITKEQNPMDIAVGIIALAVILVGVFLVLSATQQNEI